MFVFTSGLFCDGMFHFYPSVQIEGSCQNQHFLYQDETTLSPLEKWELKLNFRPVGISIYRFRALLESAPTPGGTDNFLERSNVTPKENVAFVGIARKKCK